MHPNYWWQESDSFSLGGEFGGLEAESISFLTIGSAFLLKTAAEVGCFSPFSLLWIVPQFELGKGLSALKFWPVVKFEVFEEVMLGKKCSILRGHFIVTVVQCVCCLICTKETPGMCVLVTSFFPISFKEIKREMKARYLNNI